MHHAALVGAHRLHGDAPLALYRFCSLCKRHRLELFLALGAVTLAVDDHAPVFVPAYVGNGARYALDGVEHLSAAADDCRGIRGLNLYFDLFAVGYDVAERGYLEDLHQPVDERRRALAVGGLLCDHHLGLYRAEQLSLALFEHRYLCLLLGYAERFKALRNGLFLGFACKYVLIFFHNNNSLSHTLSVFCPCFCRLRRAF